MNGYSAFANSPAAGYLVAGAVLCFTFALLGAIWTLERWIQARRDGRARDLRLQRARRPRLITMAGRVSGTAAAERGMASGAQRARAAGIDELVIDDLTLWAERSR